MSNDDQKFIIRMRINNNLVGTYVVYYTWSNNNFGDVGFIIVAALELLQFRFIKMMPFHLFLNVSKPQNNKYTLYFMCIFVILDVMSVKKNLSLEKYTEMTPMSTDCSQR